MAGTITASVVKNDTTSPPQFQNSAGTEIGTLCRAWVSFVGSTATIRSSFNVSSITRNAAGNYTVNFSTSMPDVNYSVLGTGELKNTATYAGQVLVYPGGTYSTSAVQVVGTNVYTGGYSFEDLAKVNVAVFR